MVSRRVLCDADPGRLTQSTATEWGSYYDSRPKVVAGKVADGMAALNERVLYSRILSLFRGQLTELAEVLGNDSDGVTGVRLKSTAGKPPRDMEASGLFLAIGHTPNTQFLEGKLDLTPKRYIKWTVPFRTNTSVEGVFAAGDVGDDYYRQAVTAAGSGCAGAPPPISRR